MGRGSSVEHTVDVTNSLTYFAVGNLCGPACANAFNTTHQHSEGDRNVLVTVILKQVFHS